MKKRFNKGISTRHKPFICITNATMGLTLVSLVITVIVLLILAGITINLTLGEHGIINMAKQAGKNYMDAEQYERNQLNTLNQEFMNQVYGIGSYETSPQYSNFKQLIANAITAQGVETTTQDSEEKIIENIDKILQARTKDATATADDIAEGKTAYVNGELITGNGKSLSSNLELSTIRLTTQNITTYTDNYKQLSSSNFIYLPNKLAGNNSGWSTDCGAGGSINLSVPLRLTYDSSNGRVKSSLTTSTTFYHDSNSGGASTIYYNAYMIIPKDWLK